MVLRLPNTEFIYSKNIFITNIPGTKEDDPKNIWSFYRSFTGRCKDRYRYNSVFIEKLVFEVEVKLEL